MRGPYKPYKPHKSRPQHRRKMRGGSIFRKFLSKANRFLKKHKVLSRAAKYGVPLLKGTRFARYAPRLKLAGQLAKTQGYGLRLAGNGLGVTGNGCCSYRKPRRRKR